MDKDGKEKQRRMTNVKIIYEHLKVAQRAILICLERLEKLENMVCGKDIDKTGDCE